MHILTGRVTLLCRAVMAALAWWAVSIFTNAQPVLYIYQDQKEKFVFEDWGTFHFFANSFRGLIKMKGGSEVL
jgi:hypothetical protein